jgi:hypothetical protein
VVLRRQDGTFVAAVSARGATAESILEAAKEDCYRVIEAKTFLLLGKLCTGSVHLDLQRRKARDDLQAISAPVDRQPI